MEYREVRLAVCVGGILPECLADPLGQAREIAY